MTTDPARLYRLAQSAVLTGLACLITATAQAGDMAATASPSTALAVQGESQPLLRPQSQSLGGLYRVSPERTPSGFAVPRFVSLKFGKVNARTGPSRNHSIAYQYQRRGLPLIVVAETEMWRKVRDIQGDEAWVRKPALSGETFAVTTTDAALYAKPGADARLIARIETGALLSLEDCDDGDYCRVKTRGGIKGYMPRHVLWGAQDMG